MPLDQSSHANATAAADDDDDDLTAVCLDGAVESGSIVESRIERILERRIGDDGQRWYLLQWRRRTVASVESAPQWVPYFYVSDEATVRDYESSVEREGSSGESPSLISVEAIVPPRLRSSNERAAERCRVTFILPSGAPLTHTFRRGEPVSALRERLRRDVAELELEEYVLCVMYPYRELSDEDGGHGGGEERALDVDTVADGLSIEQAGLCGAIVRVRPLASSELMERHWMASDCVELKDTMKLSSELMEKASRITRS